LNRIPLRCQAIIAPLVVAVLAMVEPAAAWNWAGGKWPQAGVPGPCAGSCVPSPVTITYSYENMFDGGLLMPNDQPLPAELIKESVEDALSLWASVAPLHFIEVEDDGLPYGMGSTSNGQIRLRHIYINGPDPQPPALPIAKARAYFPSGSIIAGDIEFDHGDRWQEFGTLPQPDILGATIHELGHSLGLGHAAFPQANMYWIFTRYQGPGTGALYQDDIEGIQYIYGAGRGSVTPLVPEPASIALLLVAAGGWLAARRVR
jgi:hypothetical protein